MSLHAVISTAIVQAQVPDVSFWIARENAGTSQIAAGSYEIATAKNSHHQQEGPAFTCEWIGVRVRPMTRTIADSLGMTVPYGAIFDRPKPGSPAVKAKIEAGDVVTAINRFPVCDWQDFATRIAKMAPGTTVYLTTWRNIEFIDVPVTLGFAKCPASGHDASWRPLRCGSSAMRAASGEAAQNGSLPRRAG